MYCMLSKEKSSLQKCIHEEFTPLIFWRAKWGLSAFLCITDNFPQGS